MCVHQVCRQWVPPKDACLPCSTFWCTAWMPLQLFVSTTSSLSVSCPGSSVRQAEVLLTEMVSWTFRGTLHVFMFVCSGLFCFLFLWWHRMILSYQLYNKKSEKLLFFFWKIILFEPICMLGKGFFNEINKGATRRNHKKKIKRQNQRLGVRMRWEGEG